MIVTAPLFAIEMGGSPMPIEPATPSATSPLPATTLCNRSGPLTEIRGLLALVPGSPLSRSVTAAALRSSVGSCSGCCWRCWSRSTVILPWGLVAGTPVEVLFAIPLIPMAVTVAIVRYQLLDIRLVVSRLLAWLMLLLVVVVAYAGAGGAA